MLSRKGQMSIEILIIVGILIVGSVITGAYYLNSINKTEESASKIYTTQEQFEGQVGYHSGDNNGTTITGGYCGDGNCDDDEDCLCEDCPPCSLNEFILNLELLPPIPQPINTSFGIRATVNNYDTDQNVVIKKITARKNGIDSSACSYNGTNILGSLIINSDNAMSEVQDNNYSFTLSNISCSEDGNYTFLIRAGEFGTENPSKNKTKSIVKEITTSNIEFMAYIISPIGPQNYNSPLVLSSKFLALNTDNITCTWNVIGQGLDETVISNNCQDVLYPKNTVFQINNNYKLSLYAYNNTTNQGALADPVNIYFLDIILQVEPPKADPNSGVFPIGQNIYLSCPTIDATIFFTIDGTPPTENSLEYIPGTPIQLTNYMQLNAVAYKKGWHPSRESNFIYDIVGATHYFDNIEITRMPSSAQVYSDFNIEVTAQTDIPAVYVSEVQILSGSPTNSCYYLGNQIENNNPIQCSNGICNNLGTLLIEKAPNEYMNFFKFRCDSPGTYSFKFIGTLASVSHETSTRSILINIPTPQYNCLTDAPIPGQIWCLEDLDYIRRGLIVYNDQVNVEDTSHGTYTLMRDLDFNNSSHYRNINNKPLWTTGFGWAPISDGLNIWDFYNVVYIRFFSGIFNGNNYKIKNLYIDRPTTQYVGLFGTIDTGAIIRDLTLENSIIRRPLFSGILVGKNLGTIINCSEIKSNSLSGSADFVAHNSGTIINSHTKYGRMVRYNYGTIDNSTVLYIYDTDVDTSNITAAFVYYNGGSITNSSVSGNSIFFNGGIALINDGNILNCHSDINILVFGVTGVGGLVGSNWGTISNSYSTGDVISSGIVGGLVGTNYDGNISNSYSTGSLVKSTSTNPVYPVGGLIGSNTRGWILNSHSTSNVQGTSKLGGLIGYNIQGTVMNCYSTGNVIGRYYTVSQYSTTSTGSANVGGLIGTSSGNVQNNYSSGSVIGRYFVGGFIGSASGTIQNNYALGDVTYEIPECAIPRFNCPPTNVYNFIGSGSANSINNYAIGKVLMNNHQGSQYNLSITSNGFSGSSGINNFWDKDNSLQTSCLGDPSYPNSYCNAIPKTTNEMKTITTFTNAGWDFTDIWAINPSINNGYPYLVNNPPQ